MLTVKPFLLDTVVSPYVILPTIGFPSLKDIKYIMSDANPK